MAETVSLSRFLPLVMPYVMGAPEMVVQRHIRMAVIEWCERTRCWRQIVDMPVTGAGRAVMPMPFATVHEFEFAEWHDAAGNVHPLCPTQFSDIETSDTAEAANVPGHITQIEPGTLSLYPPTTVGSVRISAFLKPRSESEYALVDGEARDKFDVCPRFILDQYSDQIASGSIARVLRVPQQSFTDLKMSAFYLARFEEAMDRRFSTNIRGQQRKPVRTRPAYF